MDTLELYAYSTENYLKKGLVKVGHCKIGRHHKRIKEQFGTSNPEQPQYILLGELPNGITDKSIHAQLIKNGCKQVKGGPGKEWFHATFNDVRVAYNEVVNGISRILNYSLRQEQSEVIEKAKKWFLNGYSEDIIRASTHPERFLVNAKMRFGKCFTSIHLAKSLSAKNILIVTYKPDVIGEWIDTVNNQIAFDGWTGIRAKKKADRPNDPYLNDNGDFPNTLGPIVLCVSLQDLSIDAKGKTKDRLQKIPLIEWDLVIFDEVHYGSRTERAKHILNYLKSKRLDLSGTPFRLIEQDDFCSQQVYTYSYLDEQKNKQYEIEQDPKNKKPKTYRQMPDLNISTIEITEEDIFEQRETFQTDDIDFSLNRLFETREGKFVYEDAVDHFIEGLTRSGHEARAISAFGKLGSQLGVPTIRHTVWWLSRVESISTLIEKLKRHPYFSKFSLINASGSDTSKDDDENIIAREKSAVQEAIDDANNNPQKLGTITLTCGRFLTGVTVKEWDSILILNDIQSAESYFQAIFRVQSAWVDDKTQNIIKPKAWVFDFAITRCLRITYDCASNIADQIDQQESFEQKVDINKDNLEITVAGLCDTLDIKRFYEGSLVSTPTTSKDIFEVLNHEGSRVSLARRITSNVLVNFGSLKLLEEHPHLFEILNKVKGYRTQDVGSMSVEDLVQIGIDAEKLEATKNDPAIPPEEKEKAVEDFIEKEKDEERQSQKKWFSTQIKRLAICMADFIYMTYQREYNIDDVIQTKEPQFFQVMTGISKEDFTELCEKGFINRFALNRIVREFRDQENTSLDPEEYILENLKKAS
ncbi:MAG: DEAD/DEAH box helicase family protein [Bacteriovorax sp.]|nr:DEAD/DEAH box helicase family protein [Bacteriovorax sp.]